MAKADSESVKILLRFYSDLLEEETVEALWAEVMDHDKGLYQLQSIPFYAPLVSPGDVVYAEYDQAEQMLTYRETVEYSGNSTVQVILLNRENDIRRIRNLFEQLGCTSEQLNDTYFSMQIPAALDYAPVKAKLDELESAEVLSYAEPCLSLMHLY